MPPRLWLVVVALSVCAMACGVLPGSTPAPTSTNIVAPAPAAAAASPSPAPAASPSPSPPAAAATTTPAATAEPAGGGNVVYVGNTDSEGVFLRKTPNMDDHLEAYPDGTRLTVIGDDVEGDGQTWKHVRTPDGTEGYVPAQYTTATPD